MKPLTLNVKTLFIAAFLLNHAGQVSLAQKPSLPAYKPSDPEIRTAYKRMELMDSLTKGTVLKASIQPGWQSDGHSFWYRNILKDSLTEYFYVRPSEGKRSKAFDNNLMAKALSAALDTTLSAGKLMVQDLRFDTSEKTIYVKTKDKWFRYDTDKQTATKVDKPAIEPPKSIGWTNQVSRWRPFRADSISPDKKQKAFVRNGNIYLSAPGSKDTRQLTYDGNPLKPYGELSWSPDGTYLVCYRITPQEEKQISIILSSLQNTTRGEVKTRGYAQPGDEFTSYEMHVIHVQSRKSVKVKSDVIDFFEAPVIRWRSGDQSHFTYEKVDRGHQRFRVIEVDAANGETKNIIDEKTETFI